MAALEPLESGDHPSISDTITASSDILDAPVLETSAQADVFPLPTPLPSPRNLRSQSLALSSAPPAVAKPLAIRRKPLSSTISPLATRYTSPDYLEIAHEIVKPDQRFSRPFSVDSPTLYEFPDRYSPPVGPPESVAPSISQHRSQP
jgi:hypothetical protein